MKAENYWHMFLETGAPELYLMYTQAKKTEESYVFDGTGSDTTSNKLQ